MKKYINIIEKAGIIMMFLGVILGHAMSMQTGAICVLIGMVLWVITVLWKALKWNEYRRENITNIYVMIGAIVIIIMFLLNIRP